MITLTQAEDLNWINLYRIAYQGETLALAPALLAQVDDGNSRFTALIDAGLPCYGVTTGLGQMVTTELDAAARAELPANMLRARAVAIGVPFARPVARAMLLLRLVNYLGGRAGVRRELVCYLVDRLNDDFTPWVPLLGHGMAADAIANTHAFQTLIGEGFVYGADQQRMPAATALKQLGVAPFVPQQREGLALINGVCAAPALAMDGFYLIEDLLKLADLIAAVSIEGLSADKDAYDPVVAGVSSHDALAKTIAGLRRHLNHSQITAHKLQAPISFRVIPQVHAALLTALAELRREIEFCLLDYSDNPLMDGERLLSVGNFHNQQLVNRVEQLALALAHLGCLSERRLHRLLDATNTGLNSQLAARPGLDAGLVVTHKAAIDLAARLRLLAQPLSLHTSETSGGQEDYMSMAIPAIARLSEMADLCRALLAYELLAALTALRQRRQTPGDGVAAVLAHFDGIIAPLHSDRSPAPDVEAILLQFQSPVFIELYR